MLLLILLAPWLCTGQKGSDRSELTPAGKIKRDIDYLASDELEGRRAGSPGETLAANYIEKRFRELMIPSFKSSSYQEEFVIKDGIKVGTNAYFSINDNKLKIGNEVIHMPYSHGNELKGLVLPFVDEPDNVWLISMKSLQADFSNNVPKLLYEAARDAINHHSGAVIFFNDIDPKWDLRADNQPNFAELTKPVLVINHQPYVKYIKPNMKKDWISIDAQLGYEDAHLHAKNVIAMIDNQASSTIVFSADYDHLGMRDSIMNGANNNASGVASLLALAEMIKTNGLRNYNYLFIAFSGSKYNDEGVSVFLKEHNALLTSLNCVIDLNMLGRFDKASRAVHVAGAGTCPFWGLLLQKHNKSGFALKIDSAGLGFGSYAHFYKKNIPVLSFSTGYTNDFAKPSDDAGKINTIAQVDINNYIYRMIAEVDMMSKLIFNKTTNLADKLSTLRNQIGLVPDLSYEDDGLRVAFCLIDKAAERAGLEPGDIIRQIAEFPIIDFDDYVLAMNKLPKGREVTVTVMREGKEFRFFVSL